MSIKMNSKLKKSRLYVVSGKIALCTVLCLASTSCIRQGGNILSTVPYGVDTPVEELETLQAEMDTEKAEASKQREKSRMMLEE